MIETRKLAAVIFTDIVGYTALTITLLMTKAIVSGIPMTMWLYAG
jgi:hypothetical protein